MAPRTTADRAIPISTPGMGTPMAPSTPPNAITRGNVTGSTQIAGAPSWAPHMPTATIAMTWSRPKIGCSIPATKPPPTSPWPTCASATAGAASQHSASQRASVGVATEAIVEIPPSSECVPGRVGDILTSSYQDLLQGPGALVEGAASRDRPDRLDPVLAIAHQPVV